MSASSAPRRVLTTVDDVVAVMPHLVGYHPGDGDVAVFMADQFGKPVVTANLVGEDVPAVGMPRVCEEMVDVALRGEVAEAIVVGYGHEGTGRAAALRDALAGHLGRVHACAVQGGQWGDVARGSDRVEQWYGMPDVPEWAEEGFPAPARTRNAVVAGAEPIPGEEVRAHVSDKAHATLRDATGPVRLFAAEAIGLLAKAGPGSKPSTRAMFAALVARDKNVRDVVLLDVVNSDPTLLANLEYAARTAADQDVAQMCSMAGTARYLGGKGDALTRRLLERGRSTALGELALGALGAGLNPALLRDALQRGDGPVRDRDLVAPDLSSTPVVPGSPPAPGPEGHPRVGPHQQKGPEL